MALTDLRLNLMAFPQHWDGSGFDVHVLLLPRLNPTQAQGPAWPAFAGTTLPLRIVIRPGLDKFPKANDPASELRFFGFNCTAPAGAPALFQALVPPTVAIVDKPVKSVADLQLKKALPASYTQAFAFEQPRRPFLVVGDGYGCSIRSKNPRPEMPPPKMETTWGELLSYALRQPELARALGLLYKAHITLDAQQIAEVKEVDGCT